MEIRRIKRERQRGLGIQFLKEAGALNLYLYEGLLSRNPAHTNLFFSHHGKIFGVAHTKSGVHVHLFLMEGIAETDVRRIRNFLERSHPGPRSFFGDRKSIEKLLGGSTVRGRARGSRAAGGLAPQKLRSFVFMALGRGNFTPRIVYPVLVAKPHMAEALVNLQIQYEVEELGVVKTAISREMTLAGLRARIARREVTVLFDGKQLVACAGVNARFEATCQIGSVYVLPEHRGKGYGSSVTSAHVQRLLERYSRVVLFVRVENAVARHMYERLGFHAEGELTLVHLKGRSTD